MQSDLNASDAKMQPVVLNIIDALYKKLHTPYLNSSRMWLWDNIIAYQYI